MKRTLHAALTCAALALPVAAAAKDTPFAGTPITQETLVANAEMIRIADALDAAVDAKDWDLARGFFSDDGCSTLIL